MLDSNIAAGAVLKINGGNLLAGEDLTVDGSAETDGSFLIYGGKGADVLTGGANSDIFFFAHDGRLGAGDHIDGGGGVDGLFIRGNFTVDFNHPDYFELIRNIENITLTSVTDIRYARSLDTEFDYDIITDDGMAAAGTTLTINGGLLQANETMKVDGHHESNAILRIFGGASDDTITGGALGDTLYGGLGADVLKGNGGNDVFRYISHTETTAASRDHILDLTTGDKIDFSGIDAMTGGSGNDAFSFIGNGAFSGVQGQLRAENISGNDWLIQADRNGDGVADMELLVTTGDAHIIGASDFFL
jgi:Ca2+-binding RTX toxin-like protein